MPGDEFSVEFTLHGVGSLAEAMSLATGELHRLGVFDTGYGYTTSVRLVEVEQSFSAEGEAVTLHWDAEVQVRGRPR